MNITRARVSDIKHLLMCLLALIITIPPRIVWAQPMPGDVFREYSWKAEKFHVLSLDEKPIDLPAEIDLVGATRAEIAMEMANEHMGFKGMAIRLNGNQWYPIKFPELSPKDPSPSLWFHHWYPTIPVALGDLKSGKGNTFEMTIGPKCFDGTSPLNGKEPLKPWAPVYGVTVRVYYDPARKPHPTGKVLTPVAQSNIGLSADLTASAKSESGAIRQIDFIGHYEDINYEGDGVYHQWHDHLFHGQIMHHLGSTTQPDGKVTWDTSWVPDQPGPMEIAARITDSTGLIYMTEAVTGIKLVRPGLSVELCKPFNVPRSFTGCQYGTWVIPGVRTENFTIKGDLSKILDARYVIPSWGNLKECHGYKINDVLLEDNPAGTDYFYNLSTPPIRPLTALKPGENTFSTVAGPGRMPDIYMPGVQMLIRYRASEAGVPQSKALVPVSPAVQKVRDQLQNTSAASKEELARDFAALVPGGLNTSNKDLMKFTEDLVQGLSGKTVSAGLAAWLAGDLEEGLNPSNVSVRQAQIAIRDFAHGLKVGGMDHAQADLVGADLRSLAGVSATLGRQDTPAHKYHYALSDAPKYDKFVLVEDFESGIDIFKTWYQPYWSTGIVGVYDSQNKSSGKYGLTISNAAPPDKRTGMAKVPRLPQDITGLNALRMWIKPYGIKNSELSIGFIDGTSEIWQIDIPDMVSGTQPYILQVRLADFQRVLRRNNGKIDLENKDFAIWMTGPYKFTVDDIMFVHDPALPEFPSH